MWKKVKKIYNYLPVIFFNKRARALDFPPAPCRPLIFYFMTAPLLFFSELYLFKCFEIAVLTVVKENFWGVLFCCGTSYRLHIGCRVAGLTFNGWMYTRACSWLVLTSYFIHSLDGYFLGILLFCSGIFFGFYGIFYFFCWFDVFWLSGFFGFLMFFGDFLDFSTIFFLEVWTSFTHQKGYNLLQFSCNSIFFVYTGWRDKVTP